MSELVGIADKCIAGYLVPWVHALQAVVYHGGRFVYGALLEFAIFVHYHDDFGTIDEDPLDSVAVKQFVEFLKREALAVLGFDVLDDFPVLFVKDCYVSACYSPQISVMPYSRKMFSIFSASLTFGSIFPRSRM